MNGYLIIYEWTGSNYSAYAPDLPGCIACGDTREETEQLMKDAQILLKEKFTVSRAPFGWYKSFNLSCKGHPLSELSREFSAEKGQATEIKELSTADLNEKLLALQKNYTDLKMAHAITPMENPLQLRSLRRTVARIATELTKRELQ